MSKYPQRPAARRERGWLSFFVGLTLGLTVALFVYLRPDLVSDPALGPVAAASRSAESRPARAQRG